MLRGLLKLGHWAFPRVAGVINVPTLRPDGTVLDQQGYDPVTQLWLEPDQNLLLPALPEQPSQEEAAAALGVLKELLTEFPFINDVDRSVALAAMLTAVLRGAFLFAPLSLFVSPTAGTGKSYLVDLIATIITGRQCPVISMGRNEEEFEKRLDSILLEATPLISIDNCKRDIEGERLCQMITQPIIKPRVLGKVKRRNANTAARCLRPAIMYGLKGI